MPDSTLRSSDFFRPYVGQVFPRYNDLREQIRRDFNARIAEVPPNFSYLLLMDWAKEYKWIERVDQGFKVVAGATTRQ